MSSSITTIYINSKNRNTGSISNFSYTLPQGIPVADQYYISSVSIPYSSLVTIYPGSQGFPTYTLTDAGGTNTGTLTPGNYTAFAAGQLLKDSLNTTSGGANYDVQYDSNDYRFTIIRTDVTNFTLVWPINQLTGQNISYTYGFQPTTLTGNSIYVSTQAATSSGTSYNYYIKSQCLTLNGSYSYFNDQKDSVVCQVPINAATGGLIQFVNPLGEWIPLRAINLNNLDIKLVDEFDNEVNTQGLDWTMTLYIRNKSY